MATTTKKKQSKVNIKVIDFDLFLEINKALAKLVESAKFTIGPNGLSMYGTKPNVSRCEVVTNSVVSDEEISFVIQNMNMYVKLLSTVKDIHGKESNQVSFSSDGSVVLFSSKKMKNKLVCCDERIVEKWISKQISSEMTPVFEFRTTSDLIRRLNQHTYIHPDTANIKIYINTQNDMEKNVLFATLGNRESRMNNELTLEFGEILFGKIPHEIVLNLERLNLFNIIQSKDIRISVMNIPIVMTKYELSGTNDTTAILKVCCTMLKE